MKTPPLIQFHGLDSSEALADSARQKAEKLSQFAADNQTCRIDIEQLAKANVPASDAPSTDAA